MKKYSYPQQWMTLFLSAFALAYQYSALTAFIFAIATILTKNAPLSFILTCGVYIVCTILIRKYFKKLNDL